MAHQTNDVKQFLDKAGVEALWDRIYNGFAPRWQSYKPSNTASTTDDRKPADFINTYVSDYIVGGEKDGRKSLDVTFISAGAIADAEGNKYGRDLIVQIPEVKAHSSATAEDGEYGVMSPDDKWKLDHVGTTAENAVTIKDIKVGIADESGENKDIRKLTISSTDKFVNWDLQYNQSTNTLDIIDINSTGSSKIMTSVSVDDMLSDAIKRGFLSGVDLVDTNASGVKGMYLKFVFTTGIGEDGVSPDDESKIIYVDVKDLVDVYTAGDGITITNTGLDASGNTTIDKTHRTGTITLKIAQTGEIGGVKIYKDNSDYEVAARTSSITANVTGTNHRNFGVEIDKDDKAFVNVPITNITINDTNPEVKAATISPVTGGSFDIITDYNAVADQNSVDGWVITPTTATITVSKETDWSTAWQKVEGNDVTSDGDKTLEFGKPFKVFKDIVEGGTNGHATVKSVATLTMPTETTLILPTATKGTDNNITTIYANAAETINGIANVPVSHQSITITTEVIKNVDNHTIVCETTDNKFDICIPAIEESFIDSLVYRLQ